MTSTGQGSAPRPDEEGLTVFDHIRADDGEHVGYLGMTEDGRFVPFDRMRRRRGEPMDLDDAERLLDEAGLRFLAESWLVRLDDGQWAAARIVEIRRDAVVVARALEDLSEHVAQAPDLTRTIELALPTERLVPER